MARISRGSRLASFFASERLSPRTALLVPTALGERDGKEWVWLVHAIFVQIRMVMTRILWDCARGSHG